MIILLRSASPISASTREPPSLSAMHSASPFIVSASISSYSIMDQPHRRTRKWHLMDMSVNTLLMSLALVLPSCVSAYQPVYFRSQEATPFIPPQVPLADSQSLSGTHEFVRFMPSYVTPVVRECLLALDPSPHRSARSL